MFGWFKKKLQNPNRRAANDKVRGALRAHGDDGSSVRHVIHFAYPVEDGSTASKDAVKMSLVAGEYAFTETEESAGIVFEHHREVASGGFDDLTADLEKTMKMHGWKYDGWECAVETGE